MIPVVLDAMHGVHLNPFILIIRTAIGFIRIENYFPTRSAARAVQG